MKLSWIFLLFSLSFILPKNITAQSSNSIVVSPAFQEVEVEEATSSATVTVTVENTSPESVALEIIPTSVDQENLSGRISLELFSGAANQSFPYLSFSVDRFVVEGNSSQQITATINNRSSLQPGGNYVGIVFRQPLDQPSSEQVVLPAVASFLLINKQGGEVYNLSLADVIGEPGAVAFRLPEKLGLQFSNQGNTHLQPRGTISITGLNDRLVAQSTINESSLYILPARSRLLEQYLRSALSPLPIDFLTVTIEGSSGGGRTPYQYEDSFVYVAPYVLIVFLVITLGSLSFIFLTRNNKHNE